VKKIVHFRTDTSYVSIIILIIILVIILFPIFSIVMTSFQKTRDIITYPPKYLFSPTLKNYIEIIKLGLIDGLKNSLIVGSFTILLTFIFGSPFSFIISRNLFKRKDDIRFWILTQRIMPPIAVIIPFIYLWSRVGLFDTYIALVTTYLTFSLPLYIWLSIESFKSVPQEIEEAAALEGCTLFQVFAKISIPIALPGLISALLFTFVFVWNEFFFVFALSSKLQTLPLIVASHGQAVYTSPWGTLSAFTSLLSIPPIVLMFFFSKFLTKYFIITE